MDTPNNTNAHNNAPQTNEDARFQDFDLHDTLRQSLQAMFYKTPTPIQVEAIPLALNGKDILGTAQTGTGKTAAFAIPLVNKILTTQDSNALVMAPTRELAKQVLEVIHQLLGKNSSVKTAFIIGGESISKQMNKLKAGPRIIVGTPGRINDHLDRGTIKLHNTGFLVLDETDRMMDMGFGIQIDKIIAKLPTKHQTLLFSATLPKAIMEMASKYLYQPERIAIGKTNIVAPKIKQEAVLVNQPEKYQELLNQLHEREGSVILFIKTKHGADKLAKKLNQDDIKSDALHGDLRQSKRTRVMKDFQDMKFRVLVATDIAARGLDVPHIEHVINYDLPQVAEDYIHRMGRTARAGANGSAVSFIAPHDKRMWNEIECLLDPSKKKNVSNDRGGKTSRRTYKSGDGGKRKPFGGKSSTSKKFGDKKPFRAGKPSAKPSSDRASSGRPSGKPSGKKPFRAGKPKSSAGAGRPNRTNAKRAAS